MDARIVAAVRQKIARHGHVVVAIGGGGQCVMCGDEPHTHENEIPFAYTVGMLRIGLPELIVFGLSAADSHRILDHLVNLMRRTEGGFTHGQRISLGGRHPLVVAEANRPVTWTKYVKMPVHIYFKPTFPVLQLLVPDTNGRLPPRCDPPFAHAPMLSTRYPSNRTTH